MGIPSFYASEAATAIVVVKIKIEEIIKTSFRSVVG